jgi:hypothetical protein
MTLPLSFRYGLSGIWLLGALFILGGVAYGLEHWISARLHAHDPFLTCCIVFFALGGMVVLAFALRPMQVNLQPGAITLSDAAEGRKLTSFVPAFRGLTVRGLALDIAKAYGKPVFARGLGSESKLTS